MEEKTFKDFARSSLFIGRPCFFFLLFMSGIVPSGAMAQLLCEKTYTKFQSMNPEQVQISVLSDGFIARIKDMKTKSEKRIEHAIDARWAPLFSSDRNRLLMALDYRTIRFFDMKAGKYRDFKIEGTVNDVKFSPDGSRMLVASEANEANLFNLLNGELEAVIRHSDGILAAQFSPDSSRVVTASRDYTAKVGNLKTNQIETILEHDDYVLTAQFSSDSSKMVSASLNGSIKVLDLKTGKIKTMQAPGNTRSAQFSSDGLSILVTLEDGSSKSFDLQTQ